jgi:twitching motility protein PilT
MSIESILNDAVRAGASDVLLSAGAPVIFHVDGELRRRQEDRPLTPAQCRELIGQVLTDDQARKFETAHELDLGFDLEGVGRFRVNVFRQRQALAAVFRLVPDTIPHYRSIGLEEGLVQRLTGMTSGLLLVTGPTGSGKSTTVASLLDHLNSEGNSPRHIITLEDPIEFSLPSRNCLVDQREVGVDTADYTTGLRSALRQMSHIIFVGEMRDRQTIEVAMSAAETGNLVISTLATRSAVRTISRLIDFFPVSEQHEVRSRLAASLCGVVSQILLPRRDEPGRVAAREVLLVNHGIANLIRENKVHQIANVMAGAAAQGMVLMDDALVALFRQGLVHVEDVQRSLEDPEKALQLGITGSF